jgi:hypothetical protein
MFKDSANEADPHEGGVNIGVSCDQDNVQLPDAQVSQLLRGSGKKFSGSHGWH